MPNAIGNAIDVCLFSVAKVENTVSKMKWEELNDLKNFSMKRNPMSASNKVKTSGRKVLLSDKVSGLKAKQDKTIKRRMGVIESSFKIKLDTITTSNKLTIEIKRKSVNEKPNSLAKTIPVNNCGASGSDCQSESRNAPELTYVKITLEKAQSSFKGNSPMGFIINSAIANNTNKTQV